MYYVVMIGQLILSLSILIVLHELGHFVPAKLFGTRVDKFYLFFDPYFSLFKIKRGETEYGIGWLPLGGYVKIAGMIDESMDREQMKGEPQPWEFRSKPAWQRLIIMLGGVTVNFILGFLIYAGVLFVWGEEFIPNKNVEYGIHVDSLGMQLGLENGDKIIKVGDQPFDKFNDRLVMREIVINGVTSLTVQRNGSEKTLPIDEKFSQVLTSSKNKGKALFAPRVPMVLNEVTDKGPADLAGLEEGDKIVGLGPDAIDFYDQFVEMRQNYKNKTTEIRYLREGQSDTLSTPITLNEEGLLKAKLQPAIYFFDTERQDYTLGQALPAGVTKGLAFLGDQMKAFGKMFQGKIKAKDNLGGFGSIGKMFGGEWRWERFWQMTAFLSLILAFFNLLPIPALDGGHVMFLLFEVVTGRKPSDQFMEYATIAGFVIVISLFIYANALDILRGLGWG